MFPNRLFTRITAKILLLVFLANFLVLPQANAVETPFMASLPKPGQMVGLSPAFSPVVLKGIKLDPKDPMKFNFLVDPGNSVGNGLKPFPTDLKSESEKLIKYFLASLTIPEEDLWVNLSPYEKNRIVPQEFGQTQMGRDLLAQDYLLKQITASLIYPEGETGRKFWKEVYAQAQAKYGTTNIPVNTFNKVWIVPEKAVVYENGGTVFVLENHLKVMLEEDYLSGQKHAVETRFIASPKKDAINGVSTEIIREIVIPKLEQEVNHGANFAQLRQVFYSLILATWYKKKIKDSILAKIYADKNKTEGIRISDQRSLPDRQAGVISGQEKLNTDHQSGDEDARPLTTDRIYQQYLSAFKKGVFNYIKEEADPINNQNTPRKYFSGGVEAGQIWVAYHAVNKIDRSALSSPIVNVEANFRFLKDQAIKPADQMMDAKWIKNEYRKGILGALLESAGLLKDGKIQTLEDIKKISRLDFYTPENYGRALYTWYSNQRAKYEGKRPKDVPMTVFIARDLGFIGDDLWGEYCTHNQLKIEEQKEKDRVEDQNRISEVKKVLRKEGMLGVGDVVDQVEHIKRLGETAFIKSKFADVEKHFQFFSRQVQKGRIVLKETKVRSIRSLEALRAMGLIDAAAWKAYEDQAMLMKEFKDSTANTEAVRELLSQKIEDGTLNSKDGQWGENMWWRSMAGVVAYEYNSFDAIDNGRDPSNTDIFFTNDEVFSAGKFQELLFQGKSPIDPDYTADLKYYYAKVHRFLFEDGSRAFVVLVDEDAAPNLQNDDPNKKIIERKNTLQLAQDFLSFLDQSKIVLENGLLSEADFIKINRVFHFINRRDIFISSLSPGDLQSLGHHQAAVEVIDGSLHYENPRPIDVASLLGKPAHVFNLPDKRKLIIVVKADREMSVEQKVRAVLHEIEGELDVDYSSKISKLMVNDDPKDILRALVQIYQVTSDSDRKKHVIHMLEACFSADNKVFYKDKDFFVFDKDIADAVNILIREMIAIEVTDMDAATEWTKQWPTKSAFLSSFPWTNLAFAEKLKRADGNIAIFLRSSFIGAKTDASYFFRVIARANMPESGIEAFTTNWHKFLKDFSKTDAYRNFEISAMFNILSNRKNLDFGHLIQGRIILLLGEELMEGPVTNEASLTSYVTYLRMLVYGPSESQLSSLASNISKKPDDISPARRLFWLAQYGWSNAAQTYSQLPQEIRTRVESQWVSSNEAVELKYMLFPIDREMSAKPNNKITLAGELGLKQIAEALKQARPSIITKADRERLAQEIKDILAEKGAAIKWSDFKIEGISVEQLQAVFVLPGEATQGSRLSRRSWIKRSAIGAAALATAGVIGWKLSHKPDSAEWPVDFHFVFNSHAGVSEVQQTVDAISRIPANRPAIVFLEDFQTLDDFLRIIDQVKQDAVSFSLQDQQLPNLSGQSQLSKLNRTIGLNENSTVADTLGQLDKDKILFVTANAEALLNNFLIKERLNFYLPFIRQEKIAFSQNVDLLKRNKGGELLVSAIKAHQAQVYLENIAVEAVLMQEASIRFAREARDAFYEEKDMANFLRKIEAALESEYKATELRDQVVAVQLANIAQDPQNRNSVIIVTRGELHYLTLGNDIKKFEKKANNIKVDLQNDFGRNIEKLSMRAAAMVNRAKDGAYRFDSPAGKEELKRIFLEATLSAVFMIEGKELLHLYRDDKGVGDYQQGLVAILSKLNGSKLDEFIKNVKNHPFGKDADAFPLAVYMLEELKKEGIATDHDLKELFHKISYLDKGRFVEIRLEVPNEPVRIFSYPKKDQMMKVNVEKNKEGGINLNPAQMDLKVKGLSSDSAVLSQVPDFDFSKILGVEFDITRITQVTNLPELLGVQ